MDKRKIILDVDTGHDDAVAIVLAAGTPSIELVGISVVAGNQFLQKTLKNTLNLCDALNIDVPVYAGAQSPLVREQIIGASIHGETGFDGPQFGPCRKKAEQKHAVQFIIDTVMTHPGEITLVPTGPLTNVALAIRLEPRVAQNVREIVFMGGSVGQGNVTASAEYNIYADPEAADIVLRSGAPLVMMPLDATLQVVLTSERLEELRKLDNPASRIFSASMDCYTKACMAYIGEAPAMHDPCCVAYIIDPSMFTIKKYSVRIELRGDLTYGRTVADVTGVSKAPVNAAVAVGADERRFWPLLANAMKKWNI